MIKEGDTAILSIGGNALSMGNGRDNVDYQWQAAEIACVIIAKIFNAKVKMALTHGNGPQVGNILLRSELAYKEGKSYPVPLDLVVADTQGSIGYMLKLLLHNELKELDPEKAKLIQVLVTQALVDQDDEAFQNPTKPIGPWMTELDAVIREKNDGWSVQCINPNADEGLGWRRVVPSPRPIDVVETAGIRDSVDGGYLTICGGGGGIPVINDLRHLRGVEGVIDKDRITALIGIKIRANLMATLTNAPGVIDPFEFDKLGIDGTVLPQITTNCAKDMVSALPKGSMGPKLEASVDFTEKTGHPSIITDFVNAEGAILEGKGGTKIVYSGGTDEV